MFFIRSDAPGSPSAWCHRVNTRNYDFFSSGAILTWEGNKVKTQDMIGSFLKDLPSSNHRIDALDVQPISAAMTDGKKSYLVGISGTVKFDKEPTKSFNQHIIVSKVGASLKIISDNLRLTDAFEPHRTHQRHHWFFVSKIRLFQNFSSLLIFPVLICIKTTARPRENKIDEF